MRIRIASLVLVGLGLWGCGQSPNQNVQTNESKGEQGKKQDEKKEVAAIRIGMPIAEAKALLEKHGTKEEEIPLTPPPGVQYCFYALENRNSVLLYHDGSRVAVIIATTKNAKGNVEESSVKDVRLD